MFDIIKALTQWVWIFIVRGVMIILGLVMVPLGLLFRRQDVSSLTPFIEHPGNWSMVNLIGIFKPWSNHRDGMVGDKRGDWNALCGDAYRFKNMFWWAAIRNPANYFSRRTLGINLIFNKVIFLKGDNKDLSEWDRGWQFMKCGPYYKFEARWRLKSINIHILMGHKIRPSHIGRQAASWLPGKSWKGCTFKININ